MQTFIGNRFLHSSNDSEGKESSGKDLFLRPLLVEHFSRAMIVVGAFIQESSKQQSHEGMQPAFFISV